MKNIFYILCLFVLAFSWKSYACEGEKNRIDAKEIPSFTVIKHKSKKRNHHGILFEPALNDTRLNHVEYVYFPEKKCWATYVANRGSICNYSPD